MQAPTAGPLVAIMQARGWIYVEQAAREEGEKGHKDTVNYEPADLWNPKQSAKQDRQV
jgi:hypothetical protein